MAAQAFDYTVVVIYDIRITYFHCTCTYTVQHRYMFLMIFLSPEDHIDMKKKLESPLKPPNCELTGELPFSMDAFEHLEVWISTGSYHL